MLVIPEDDTNANPLLKGWSQSANWMYELLTNPDISAALPQEMKDRGWKLIQAYERHTGLM